MNYNVLGRKLLIVEDDDALIREFTAYFSRQGSRVRNGKQRQF